MILRRLVVAATLAAALGAVPATGIAQTAPPPTTRESLSVQGFAMAGITLFAASQTFDAILETDSGAIFGGGLRLVIPGGPYLEVGAWRFEQDGERVFVGANNQVFPLGIPLTVQMTPLEITAGWRFPGVLGPRLTPYVGGGYTSMRYEETSEFADESENVSERYNGFHLAGGAEVRLARWVALTGDVVWTRIGGAIGEGGVSEVFDEDDLGGTSFRIRLILGR